MIGYKMISESQGYLDFLLLKKQAKYTYKRSEASSKILEMVLVTPMPNSLKEAYYEYRYGIFAK